MIPKQTLRRRSRACWISNRCASSFGLSLCLSLLLALGCSSPEEESRRHLEQGRAYLEEGNREAALIEFNNAIRANPDDPDANLELGAISLAEGNERDGLFYLGEASRLAPDDPRIGSNYALILSRYEPIRARELIDSIIEAHPDLALGWGVSSQIHQVYGHMKLGLEAAQEAVSLAPDEPAMYWQLGISFQLMIYRGDALRRAVESEIFSDGLDAFDRFVELGGEPLWKARLEQARIMGAWPEHGGEAIQSARLALEVALQSDNQFAIHQTAEHLAKVARKQNNKKVYAVALEALVDIHSNELIAWKNLAELKSRSWGGADAVYERMLAIHADNPDAHILYAGHIARTKGYLAAVQYFDTQIDAGVDPPRLLSSLLNLHLSVGFDQKADAILERLNRVYPDSPWTIIEQAQLLIRRGKVREAARSLVALIETDEIPEAFQVLAKLQLMLGNTTAARKFAQRAVDAIDRFDPKAERILAEMQFADHRYREVIETVERVEGRIPLLEEQKLMLAVSFYEVDDRRAGSVILKELVDRAKPIDGAVIEFARREGIRRARKDRARALLEASLKRTPGHPGLVIALVNHDLHWGDGERALQRLDRMPIKAFPPDVALLRARLRANEGNLTGAISDAEIAFAGRPDLDNLVEFMTSLYQSRGDVADTIARIEATTPLYEAQRSAGVPTARRDLAWRWILISRLYLLLGDEDLARRVLSDAIRTGKWVNESKIDLAYLLAKADKNLALARRLALEAVDQEPQNSRAHDTLGYVHLKQAQNEAALEQFQKAAELSDPKQALFHFHECIALEKLGRHDEALLAIEKVLAIEPDYPNAAGIRERLKMTTAASPANVRPG